MPSLDLIDGKETDDRGAYRVFRLPPATTSSSRCRGRIGAPAGAPRIAPVPVTTFYPSAVDVASALPVAVKGGDDLAGIDIQIRSEFTRRCRGT